MSQTQDAIRQLYSLREKHRQRIAQIDAALIVLGQDKELDELVTTDLPHSAELRDTVLAILADNAHAALDVGALFTAAIDRGWRSASANPRNAFASALARLAQSGEIEKAARGHYRLAAEQTAMELEVA